MKNQNTIKTIIFNEISNSSVTDTISLVTDTISLVGFYKRHDK
jgi:hypothetical protein